MALKEYFVNGIPVEETIRNHKDLFDFYLMQRSKGKLHLHSLSNEGIEKEEEKIVRYYIANCSKTSVSLYKKKENGKILKCHSGYNMQLRNKHEGDFPNDIDYSYYIHECNKKINIIEDKQLLLF